MTLIKIGTLHLITLGFLALLAGCSKPGKNQVILQTDWFAQPEHGGFYQALANGYYEDEGLEVIILQGGPNAMSTQKVLKGSVQFAMNRADAVYTMVQREVPVLFVMPTLQHDPQGVMLHQSNPISSLRELDNEKVMAVPGLSWIKWVENRYNIHLNIVPHDFGMERFLSNPSFIQQCLITNEPYYATLNGAKVKTISLATSGFDPYHGIYCLSEYAETNPETVKRFIRASLKGWEDYIQNDPSPAFYLISERNPRMTQSFMDFSYNAIKENHLVEGVDGKSLGRLAPERLDELVRLMKAYEISEGISNQAWYSLEYLPEE